MRCCPDMWVHSTLRCNKHNPSECPDVLILHTQGGVGLPVRDGGGSYIEIRFCPWCGYPLPEPERGR